MVMVAVVIVVLSREKGILEGVLERVAPRARVECRLAALVAIVVEMMKSCAATILSRRLVLRVAAPLVRSTDAILAVAIVNLALLGVREHKICLADLFELGLRLVLVVWVLIWVPLERKLPVCLLDLRLVGAVGQAQNFIILALFAHLNHHLGARAGQLSP